MNATVLDLIIRFGADELASHADRDDAARVEATFLERRARGDELADLSPEEIEATDAALATVELALGDAAAEIAPYLQARGIPLPLATVPRALSLHQCHIARYYLFADQVTEAVRKRYEDAVRFLREVAAGRASLGPDETGAPAPQAGSGVLFSGDPEHARILGRF